MKYVIMNGSNNPHYKNEAEHGEGYRGWIKTPRGTERLYNTYDDINQAHRNLPADYLSDGHLYYYRVEEVP